MLPKKNRADKKAIEKIFKEGRFISSPSFAFKFINNPENKDSSVQISVIAPKSVAKLAVKRNSLRRLGYNALAKHLDQLPTNLKGALVFKKYQDDTLIIENEIKSIFSKIN